MIPLFSKAGRPPIDRATLPDTDVCQLADWIRSPDSDGVPEDKLREAGRILAFSRIELRGRPSANPGVYGNPGASPKQLAVRDAFFSGKYRLIAAGGANRAGKNVALWDMSFCRWLRDYSMDGEVYWCIATNFDKLKANVHKWLWDCLPHEMFVDRVYNEAVGLGTNRTLRLRLPNHRGNITIEFKTEEQELVSYEMSKVAGAAWTEASREDIFDALWPRLAVDGGFMLLDYAYEHDQVWLKWRIRAEAERCAKGIIGAAPYYHAHFSQFDNAHNLPDGELEIQKATLSKRAYQLRVEGKEGVVFGAVYFTFDREFHVCRPFDIPDEFNAVLIPRYRTYDYGSAAPFACLFCALLPVGFSVPKGVGGAWDGKQLDREIVVVYAELYERQHTVPMQAKKIIRASEGQTFRPFQGRMLCDPSIFNATHDPKHGKGPPIAKMLEDEGIKCKPGKIARGPDMDAEVERVRLWLENDKILFLDICVNAILEHEMWRHKLMSDGQIDPNERYEQGNDHTCDCLRKLLAENLTFSRELMTVHTREY